MKKVKFLLLAVFAVLSFSLVGVLTACPGGDTNKVYLITMDSVDQHWKNVKTGAEKAVKELKEKTGEGQIDIAFTYTAPVEKSDAEQITRIENATSAGAKVIIIACNTATAANSALAAAYKQGIKIIFIDSPGSPSETAGADDYYKYEQIIATDNAAAGGKAATALLEKLEELEITSGKVGIIGVFSNTASTVARETGFRAAMAGKGFEIQTTQYCEGKTLSAGTIADGYITAGCVAIFATNETGAVGATSSVQTAIEDGKNIAFVGFDYSDSIQAALDDDVLYATVQQAPDQMGYKGIMSAAGLLLGTGIVGAVNIDSGSVVVKKA